jgi:hypothetical protein
LSDPTIGKWFDTAAFVAQPINTAGNIGRNTLHGPSQRRVDLSLFKDVSVSNTARLQLRVECYNVTNTLELRESERGARECRLRDDYEHGQFHPRQMQFAVSCCFRIRSAI